tara:strand:- start:1192 stop:1614 length:423 start_codon:yes stop_codon:yes gene_type:complete
MSLSKKLDKMFEDSEKEELELEELNVTGGGEAYDTPKAFKKKKKKVKESTFKKLSKQMFLGEATYRDYKKDESATQKQKVNRAIKEVNSKLFKIERIINQNMKLKTEAGIDSTKYWKSTRSNLQKISEKMVRISEKLRKF